MSEPDANTCTKISSHVYKGRLHTQTTTKGFNFLQDFGEQTESFDPQVNNIWGSHSHKVQLYAGTRNEYA
jgi:hypothetical protein